jgi:ribosome-associated translation inhibitor RaiA
MGYQITSTNLQLRPSTHELALEKAKKIEKVIKDVGEDLREIRLVINKGPRFGFLVKTEVFVPNNSFIASAGGFSIEGAVDESIEEVIRQINDHKGKTYKKNKRLLRKFKSFIFSSDLKDL